MSVHIDGANGNITITGRVTAPNLPIRLWRGLVSQLSTDAPTAIVLVNELDGTIVWTRGVAGNYLGTLAGAFPADKTFLLLVGGLTAASDSIAYIDRVDADTIRIVTQTGASDVDGLLANSSLEIAIYE